MAPRRPAADPSLVIAALSAQNPIFSRAPDQGTPLYRAFMAYTHASAIGRDWYGRRGALAQDGRLTAHGVTEKLAADSKGEALKPLRKLTHELGRLREGVAERRARLTLRSDPRDTARAIEAAELRTFLRTLGYEEAIGLANQEPKIARAIVEMPAALSGLPADLHKQLYDKALEAEFGSEIASIKELEGAIDFAATTVTLASDAVAEALGETVDVEALNSEIATEVDPTEVAQTKREAEARKAADRAAARNLATEDILTTLAKLPRSDRDKIVDAAHQANLKEATAPWVLPDGRAV